MHLLFGVFLYYGVHWQSKPPVGVQAELWEAIPETTTAPPESVVPPQPAVKQKEEEADISLQQKRRQEMAAEREQARKQAALNTRHAREEAERLEAARKEAQAETKAAADASRRGELARLESMAGRAAGGSSSGGGSGRGTASSGYPDRLRARVKPNIVFYEDVAGNPAAVVLVQLAPDGSLLSAKLIKSSGNPDWDSAVLRALERSNPLPRDENGIAPARVTITFKPKD